MGYQRGMAALHLEMTDKIPHTEFLDNDAYIKRVTGIDTNSIVSMDEVLPCVAEKLDYDYIWNIFEMPYTKGRVTKMGHAVWNAVDAMDTEQYCPFKDEEDVYRFDPAEEYGLSPTNDMISFFTDHFSTKQSLFKNAVYSGGRYNSIFSACIRTFGWEMFLTAAGNDIGRMNRVLDGFYQITRREIEAWANTAIKVYNTHDDICWTSGPVLSPAWYKEQIFPRYKKMWQPLKDAGIKIIFTSDGTYDMFFDDIFSAGADGIVMEPSNSLSYALEKYGDSKIIIGNVDCRILQYGTHEDIHAEVRRCIDLGTKCPGYFLNVGNHIPNGISVENIDCYFECYNRMARR